MEHPITPPPALVMALWGQCPAESDNLLNQFATLMARWGADQELEACCRWLKAEGWPYPALWLRAARRPKPLSLKEQALEAMSRFDGEMWCSEMEADLAVIRRALEQLDD